jgi:hypothetical protein
MKNGASWLVPTRLTFFLPYTHEKFIYGVL